MPAEPAADHQLPRSVDLGDGTIVLRDRGEIRLNAARTRWWNGRIWESVEDSTPPNARVDEAGERWWDGTEWRAKAAMPAPWERREVAVALVSTWLLWLLLGIFGVISGYLAFLLILVVSGAGA